MTTDEISQELIASICNRCTEGVTGRIKVPLDLVARYRMETGDYQSDVVIIKSKIIDIYNEPWRWKR